jgi:uncharacterized protein DUF6894
MSPLCPLEVLKVGEMMPRFYFHLMSKESRIPDERGKNFDTLNDAHEHGRKLIDKILLHVGYDDAEEWKVIVSSDEDDTQLIIPFAVSYLLSSTRRAKTADQACSEF